MKFGDVLRHAREQSGEDLVSVARRIRIRPDILERIEESDIDSMPPRGYSRNMINAYARYLGLNTTEVVKMYQNAQYRSQVEHARENIKPAGFDMPSSRRAAVLDRAHDDERAGTARRSAAPSGASASSRKSSNGFDDVLFDDIDAAIAPPKDSGNRIGAVHVGSYNAYGQGLSQRNARRSSDATRRIEPVDDARRHDGRSTHRARRSSMPEEHYTNLYAAPKNIGVQTSGWRDKLPFVVAGIVVLLLVVVFAVWANGVGRAQDQEPAAAPLNITGLPGSSSSDDAASDASEGSATSDAAADAADAQKEADAAKAAAAAPTKTVMAYDIPEGVTTYFEVYLDGKYVDGGDVTGPKTGSFDVTGAFEFRVTPPDGVTLTQDGVQVPLEAGSSGIASVEVDFADVLAKWSEEHAAAANGATDASGDSSAAGDAA